MKKAEAQQIADREITNIEEEELIMVEEIRARARAARFFVYHWVTTKSYRKKNNQTPFYPPVRAR